jgi:hypothetical protein
VITLLISLVLCNPPSTDERLLRTWNAVSWVESHGDPRAIGDGGKAHGIGQIHPCVIDDVNRILGRKKYSYADRMDPVKSFEVFCIYVRYYAPDGGPDQWCRIWNGGPKGPRRAATLAYWRKVKAAM